MTTKLLIINAIALNVGDAAILLGEIAALREAFGEELEITVSEQRPEVASRLYPAVRFVHGLLPWRAPRARGPRWAESLRRRRTSAAVRLLPRYPRIARRLLTRDQRDYLDLVAASDIVVSTGGTYFVEHYNFSTKSDEVLAAIALGKPTFLYTQSLGPFAAPDSRATLRRIVAGCARVFLRDERSRRHLVEAGADAAKLEVHADAAFALSLRDSPAARAPSKRVAISVRDWSHGKRTDGSDARERYRRAIAETARTLAAEGAEVVFLSTCQGIPEYWTDDSRFAAGIVQEFLADARLNVRVDSSFHAPLELARLFAGFDMVIATRMHVAILALLAGTPVLGIAYEFKTQELLATMGLDEFCVGFDDTTAEGLVARARALLARDAEVRTRVAMHVTAFAEDAREPARRIRDLTRHRVAR